LKKIIFAAALAALASLVVAAFASADVQRYQVPTTLVVSLTDAQPGNQHTFALRGLAMARSPAPGWEARRQAGRPRRSRGRS
jgi:hypothetical protein